MNASRSDSKLAQPSQSSKVYICHIKHPNDRIYAENLSEYFQSTGVPSKVVEFDYDENNRDLLEVFGGDALGVIGFNWELDHSWIGSRNFLDIAAFNSVPVIQWIVDHPSALWSRFTRTHSNNSRFLFLSPFSEAYFRRFIIPSCRSGSVVSTGVNFRSRLSELTREQFFARDINCLIPLNLKRVGGTIHAAEHRLAALPEHLQSAVKQAITVAQNDLDHPIERHFFNDAPPPELLEQPYLFHYCIQIIEEIVQVNRRLSVFAVASEFPVLIQSDVASGYEHAQRIASFEKNVSMSETIGRMRRARSVVSLTHINDEIHNRTVNALNAGAVNIIEDNIVHRRIFKHGKNALLFRYDDSSLRECFKLVCSDPDSAFQIAESGMALRDDPQLRFARYRNFVDLLKVPSEPAS